MRKLSIRQVNRGEVRIENSILDPPGGAGNLKFRSEKLEGRIKEEE